MGRLKQFFSDLFALLFMGIGISTTRPRQRKLDLQRLVTANDGRRGRGRDSLEHWILDHCVATSVEYRGQQAVRLEAGNREGLARIERLQNTVSKIDLNIAAVRQEVGMAFHVISEREFESICFQVGEEARREGEAQRVTLRYLVRGSTAAPTMDTGSEAHFDLPYGQSGDWFKARITISNEIIAVFIDGSNIPALRVNNSAGAEPYGSIGLWVGAGSSALIADFRIHEVRGDIESQLKRLMGRS